MAYSDLSSRALRQLGVANTATAGTQMGAGILTGNAIDTGIGAARLYNQLDPSKAQQEQEIGHRVFGRKKRERALAQTRAGKALSAYGELAGQEIDFNQIDDPRIAMELANRAAEDPRFKQEQLAALSGVRQYVDQRGITDAERAQLSQVNTAMDERLRGQRESTMQSMAQRGMGGGGQELASLMAGQQGAAQRQSMAQQQVLADAAGRRQQALGQLGSMSTAVRGQEYGMAEADRGAKMDLARFNSQQRMAQQQFNSQGMMGEQQANISNKANIYGNAANAYQSQYENMMARKEKAKDRGTQIGGKAIETSGQVASSLASSYSDIRVKENIKEADIKDMMDNITPYEYNYIGDKVSNRRISPMAQDLLQSELGSKFVFENEDGILMVDYGKALGTMMAINANLHKRVSELEDKLNA